MTITGHQSPPPPKKLTCSKYFKIFLASETYGSESVSRLVKSIITTRCTIHPSSVKSEPVIRHGLHRGDLFHLT